MVMMMMMMMINLHISDNYKNCTLASITTGYRGRKVVTLVRLYIDLSTLRLITFS